MTIDDNTTKIILALFALVSTLGMAYLGVLTRAARQDVAAAVEVSRANNALGHENQNRLDVNAEKLDTTTDHVRELRLQVNGNLEKLLAINGAAEYRRGVLSARSDEDARTAAVAQTLALTAGMSMPSPAAGIPGMAGVTAATTIQERLALALTVLPTETPVTGTQLAQVIALLLTPTRPPNAPSAPSAPSAGSAAGTEGASAQASH